MFGLHPHQRTEASHQLWQGIAHSQRQDVFCRLAPGIQRQAHHPGTQDALDMDWLGAECFKGLADIFDAHGTESGKKAGTEAAKHTQNGMAMGLCRPENIYSEKI